MNRNTIDLSKLSKINLTTAISLTKTNIGKVDVNSYFFLYRTGGQVKSTKAEILQEKKLDEELILEVTSFLIEKHPEELESAFGNIEKKERLRSIINSYISRKMDLNIKGYSLSELSFELVNAIAGLDKIDTILAEGKGTVTDIMFNGSDIWVQTTTEKPKKSPHKMSAEQIHVIAKKIANATGQLFTTAKPELDTELPNLRINAVHKAVSPYGTTMAIRVFSSKLKISKENFVNTLGSQQMLDFLIAAVRSNLNIVVTGETGTGKTELIKFLVGFILEHQGIDVIEDTLETDMKSLYPHLNIHNWRTRDSETDEDMVVSISRLLRSALRNNPNWIIVTETRGGEAFDMVKAAGTGHSIMTSFHARSTKHAPSRVITMCKEKADFSTEMLGDMIGDSLDLVIHLELDDVTRVRRIAGIGEFIGFENNKVLVNNIFEYSIVGTKIKVENGISKLVTVEEHTNPHKISDQMANQMLQKGALTPSLLTLVSDRFKKNVMHLDENLTSEKGVVAAI